MSDEAPMRLVADASALGAMIFNEESADAIRMKLRGRTVCAPRLLESELANIALKKARKDPARAVEIFGRLEEFLAWRSSIRWHDAHPTDVALLASLTGLSAYDATYLWLAGWLEADLVTLDKRLSSALGLESERPF